jgi:hypothetical protein
MPIRPSPIWVQFRDASLARRVKIDRKYFRQLFHAEWPHGNSETMQETKGMFPICLVDVSQHPLISLVERFGQFIKNASDTWRETVS